MCSRCPTSASHPVEPALPDDVAVRTLDEAAPARGPARRRVPSLVDRAGAAQADYRPKLAVPEVAAAVPEAARTGERWRSRWSVRQQELDARLARAVRCASRRAGPRRRRHQRPARSRLPRRTTAARSKTADASQAPLDVKRAKDLPRDLDARRSRVWRGTAAADRRCPRRRRRGVPHHRHRSGWSGRSAVRPPHHRPLRHRRRRDDRRTASSTSASGTWAGGETRRAGRSFDGRPRRTWSAARDSRSSPRSPRRRSAATTRSAVSSTSISTRGWRRSTRC